MTTSEHVAGNGVEDGNQGERHALELADRIRLVAAEHPELAKDLVDQLIAALDEAMEGTLREHLHPAARVVPAQAVVHGADAYGPGVSLPRNS